VLCRWLAMWLLMQLAEVKNWIELNYIFVITCFSLIQLTLSLLDIGLNSISHRCHVCSCCFTMFICAFRDGYERSSYQIFRCLVQWFISYRCRNNNVDVCWKQRTSLWKRSMTLEDWLFSYFCNIYETVSWRVSTAGSMICTPLLLRAL
jgi:hypothetical protein